MKTMETLVGEGKKVQETLNEKVKEAQDMRKEIDQVKNELAGIPGELDPAVMNAITNLEQQAKSQAISDISGVESAANGDIKTGENIKSQVDSKIADNTSAVSKLKAIMQKRYHTGAAEAIRSAEENTKTGQDATAELMRAEEKATSDINTAKSGI